MTYNNVSNKYVKFIKGSSSAFNKLQHKDSSTLYFITEDSGELKLYLGETLISSNEVKPEQLKLSELLDVTLGDEIELGSILTFDGTEWKNTSLDIFKEWLDIPELPDVMQGATETSDGTSGLVPVPTMEVRNNFLRGDGTWASVTDIVTEEVGKIVDKAPEAFDTLKEISDWILNDETGAAALSKEVGNLSDRVTTLETNVGNLNSKIGDLNSIEEGKTLVEIVSTTVSNLGTLTSDVEKLEDRIDTLEDSLVSGEIDLTQYVKVANFESFVGSLSDENAGLNSLKTENKSSLVAAINELHDQLLWGELV